MSITLQCELDAFATCTLIFAMHGNIRSTALSTEYLTTLSASLSRLSRCKAY